MSNMIENGNYCVYIHTSPNGKRYVGQTGVEPEKRWRSNGKGYLAKKDGKYLQPMFAHAILKYGWDNFKHEIIASDLTKEEADELEKSLIENLNTMNSEYGYNLREGGSHGGLSEEAKKKISEAQKGKIMSEESRKKLSEALKGEKSPLYGTHPSEEARRNMSEAQKKRVREKGFSEEHRRKISEANKGANNWNFGGHLSYETKKKMSEARSGEKHFMYGKHHNEETKRKIKESQKMRKIAQYSLQGELIKIWDCMHDIGRELNVCISNIPKCCKGERKKAYGFIWKYYEDIEKEVI